MGRVKDILGRLVAPQRRRGQAQASVSHPDDEWWEGELKPDDEPRQGVPSPIELLDTGSHPDDWFFEPKGPATDEPSDSSETSSNNVDHDPDNLAIDLELSPISAGEAGAFEVPDFPVETPSEERAQNATIRKLSNERRRALARAARYIGQFEHRETESAEADRVRLAELFQQFPHPSSVRAIASLAAAGATLAEIFAAAEVKQYWSETPFLWLRRRFQKHLGWASYSGSLQIRDAMTWRLAWQLVHAFPNECMEEVLSGERLNEWAKMTRRSVSDDREAQAAFRSYSSFLAREARLESLHEFGPDLTSALMHLDEVDQDADNYCRPVKYQPQGLPIGVGDTSPSIWVGRALANSVPVTDESDI